jgi:sulfur relay (sulfurtransferase) complex TusBCD TusD component (DsrE family)
LSANVMGAVFERGPEDRTQAFVLLAIADNSDDFGFACPSVETIAAKARCDKRTVLRVLVALQKDGWMVVRKKMMFGKGNGYFINLQRIGVTLSPKSKKSPMHIEVLHRTGDSKSRDTVSPKTSDTASPTGDIDSTPQVTFCADSGDIECNPPITPYKEEPLEPLKEPGESAPTRDYDFADDSPEIPEGLAPLQYATGVLEACCVVGGFQLKQKTAEAIRMLSKLERVELHRGAALMLARMKTAQQQGETVNTFWLEDGRWKPQQQQQPQGVKNGKPSSNSTQERHNRSIDAIRQAAEALGIATAPAADGADERQLSDARTITGNFQAVDGRVDKTRV